MGSGGTGAGGGGSSAGGGGWGGTMNNSYGGGGVGGSGYAGTMSSGAGGSGMMGYGGGGLTGVAGSGWGGPGGSAGRQPGLTSRSQMTGYISTDNFGNQTYHAPASSQPYAATRASGNTPGIHAPASVINKYHSVPMFSTPIPTATNPLMVNKPQLTMQPPTPFAMTRPGLPRRGMPGQTLNFTDTMQTSPATPYRAQNFSPVIGGTTFGGGPFGMPGLSSAPVNQMTQNRPMPNLSGTTINPDRTRSYLGSSGPRGASAGSSGGATSGSGGGHH